MTGGGDVVNVIEADYTQLDDGGRMHLEDLLHIDREQRDRIEYRVSEKIALEISSRLPKNDEDAVALLRSGYELARHMGWEAVVEKYVLTGLSRAIQKRRFQSILV